MSSNTSSDSVRSLFESALNEFEKRANTSLLQHQLAIKLIHCQDAESVISILQQEANKFNKFRGEDGNVMKWIKRTVHVLYSLSTSGVLGNSLGLSFPPANAIFAGIGILLGAIKDVSSSYDALVDLFESMENFLRLVKILIEFLSTLALATEQVKQGRLRAFGKKLLGENDVGAVLQRLDRLTQEEARTTAAQTLEVVYGLVKNMKVVMDGTEKFEMITQTELNIYPFQTEKHQQTRFIKLLQVANEMDKSRREQLQETFRRWLSPPDPSKNHNIARKSHHDGTASWFIDGNTFPEWRATGSLLWIHGKPGSGKSVLCSALIHEITKMQEAGLACLAYYYFDFRDTAKQDTRGFLTSLLTQLSAQSDSYSYFLSRLYSMHGAGSKQPNDDVLVSCLQDMLALSGQGPIYIVADALDECPRGTGTPSPRESVLEIVKEIFKLGYRHVHICVTSRPEIDIEGILKPLASHSVSLHDEIGQMDDINNYINSFINSDTKTRQWRKKDKELVINKLCEGADGMFRWVYCQLDKLRRCLPGRIRRALEELPGTLDETYERTLQDIDDENWAYAHRLLQCVTVASRPLRVEELAEFLAFDFDDEEIPIFEADWRPENAGDAVLSTCSSLLAVVNADGSQVVQFSHFSVKEFLTSERLARGRISRYYIPLEPAHLIVAQACLAVLLQLGDHINKHPIKRFPLAGYAAEHWVDHAKFGNVSSRTDNVMKRLFDPDGPHFALWIWVKSMEGNESATLEGAAPRPKGTALFYAAESDLGGVAEWLINMRSQDVNLRSGRDMNSLPLYVASMRGSVNVAKVLLKYGADVNKQGSSKWTPLHEAANSGYLEISRVLIESGADVNARSSTGRTPLLSASEEGYKDIVRLLLDHGADANAWNAKVETPFGQALKKGDQEIIRLLLEHGADVNARNRDGQTLLHLASRNKNQDIIRGLLGHGADINAQNKRGETAFQVASREGHDEVVELLLEHSAEGAPQLVTLHDDLQLTT
ncbi:hypothetical protein B0F90DRAFT_1928395 [Multifurca ochricompacta]|uniref:NACHT domain-containing protein n=1 Tax=Multifurca ochricompacta TaxID=376703 RepID=A0AAD4LWK7_9AGAM|nr:hypothetical protein B0F90DRAFT_1928395 [Multifurca ochricompacta]